MSTSPPLAIYRDLIGFIRHPRLPARQRFGTAWLRDVLLLAVLDLSLSLMLLVPLSQLSQRMNVAEPDFSTITSRGIWATLALGALAVPALEELIFRFWLDGRRGSLLVVLGIGLPVGALLIAPNAHLPVATKLAVVGAALAVPLALYMAGRGKPKAAAPWFAGHFRWFYFGSVVAFALAHLGNYPLDRPWLVLPFVLPQLIAGLILGFARVRFGYGGGLAIHAFSNGIAFALMASGA